MLLSKEINAKEIEGLKIGKTNVLNNVMVFIGADLIREQDGAKKTLENIIEKHATDRTREALNYVLTAFDRVKSRGK